MKIETVQYYQILVLLGFACVARTVNALIKHQMPVSQESVDAAQTWNARELFVYQESAAKVHFV